MRYWGVLLAVFLLGCAHPRTTVESENGVDFGRYHRIGVLPFADRHGQGQRIAAGVEAGLRGLHFEIVDGKVLDKILSKNRPDAFYGLNLDAISQIRTQTSADAILFGAVAPDWHQASISLVDMELGDTVLRATLRPARSKKIFKTPDEIVAETMRVIEVEPTPGEGE